jgi:hypothetical protein
MIYQRLAKVFLICSSAKAIALKYRPLAMRNPFGLIVGMVAGLVLLPIALPVVLLSRLFERGVDLTREEVASYIRSGLNPRDDGRWDDLEKIRIRDPRLEDIRRQALAVKFPLNEVDRNKLQALLLQLASE